MKGIGLLLRLHTCDFNIEAKMKWISDKTSTVFFENIFILKK